MKNLVFILRTLFTPPAWAVAAPEAIPAQDLRMFSTSGSGKSRSCAPNGGARLARRG